MRTHRLLGRRFVPKLCRHSGGVRPRVGRLGRRVPFSGQKRVRLGLQKSLKQLERERKREKDKYGCTTEVCACSDSVRPGHARVVRVDGQMFRERYTRSIFGMPTMPTFKLLEKRPNDHGPRGSSSTSFFLAAFYSG